MAQPDTSKFDTLGAMLAVAIGAVGGAIAKALGLPLPWLLGSIVAMAVASLAGFAPGGHVPRIPETARNYLIPVIGVSIGATFTAEVLAEIPSWWPSVLALVLYIPLAHVLGYLAVRALGEADAPTAFFGTAPGGLIESVLMGEEAGADTALLTLMQFLRLILCIILIPVGFALVTGEAVGSASGVVLGGDTELRAQDWVVLALCAALGLLVGKAIRLPAGLMTGPLALSAIAHLVGGGEGAPPGWMVDAVQLLIGVVLGARFWGKPAGTLLVALRYASANVAIALVLASIAAAALATWVGESWEAVFLAYAPGGLAEMSLVALSLEISVIYVTLHHVIRIVLAVTFAKLLAARVLKTG